MHKHFLIKVHRLSHINVYTESELQSDICEVWSCDEEEVLPDICEDLPVCDLNSPVLRSPAKALAKWLVLFISYIQAIFHLSDVIVSYFLKFFHIFFFRYWSEFINW